MRMLAQRSCPFRGCEKRNIDTLHTIISFIIICPWIVCFWPASKSISIQSTIHSSFRFSFLTHEIMRWKDRIGRTLKWFWEFTLWAFTNTTIPQTTHAIIWPKGAVTPQLDLQNYIYRLRNRNTVRIRTTQRIKLFGDAFLWYLFDGMNYTKYSHNTFPYPRELAVYDYISDSITR